MGKNNIQDYFVRSGLKEISLLRKHFKIRGQGDNVKITGEVSPTSIRDFYTEYFASVRPAKLRDEKILPSADTSKLRAWYVGQPDVNVLLNLVIRHCLYVDQVIIVDPLMSLLHYDVQERPAVWIQTILNRALCLCSLEDWIEQEIVLVVPNAFDYRPELRQLTLENFDAFWPQHTEEQKHEYEHHLVVRLLVNIFPEDRVGLLDMMESMGRVFAEGEQEDLLAEAKQYEDKYPIRFRIPSSYYTRYFKGNEKRTQVIDFSLGVPLLFAPTIADFAGAFLVFEHRFLYDLIALSQKPISMRLDSLQQLAIAFQSLDFPFLHNVPLKKALELRNKGYLRSFRLYLRELWSTIAQAEENESLDTKTFEFLDRLKSEYRDLEREWANITKDLRVKAITSGLVVGLSASSAVALGKIDWTAGALAAASAGLLKEHISGYSESSERRQNTYKNPLSVFLMLK
jgi:hypothetical protein